MFPSGLRASFRSGWTPFLCALAALTLCSAAVSPARAAVVLLKNGDRITGEVRELKDGKLAVRTSYAGLVKLSWSAVERVDTDQPFEVSLNGGRRAIGEVEVEKERVKIALQEGQVRVKPSEVIRMLPEVGFWERLQGSVDFGYNFTRGNSSLTQTSFSGSGEYRRADYVLQGSVNSIFSRQEEAEATSRQAGDVRYDLLLGEQAFVFALGSLERNDRQRLALRTNAGGGFGWRLIEQGGNRLSLLGGFTFTNEQFQADGNGDQDPPNSSGEGLAGVEWDTKTPLLGIRFSNRAAVRPNVVQGGRYRLELDSTVRVPLAGPFNWSLTLFERFDSDPRVEVQRNDYGLTSALGFSF